MGKAVPATLLAALLTACGGAPEDQPVDRPKTEKLIEDQHFCCKSARTGEVGQFGYGEDCTLEDAANVGSCPAVLYCPSGYSIDGGTVSCPLT